MSTALARFTAAAGYRQAMRAEHKVNRASWDVLASVHGQDSYYDARALLAGRSTLTAEEDAALDRCCPAGVSGLDVLHVQCHLGFDAITLARRGAHVTGADFSAVALQKASALASNAGVHVEWVCADACELPSELWDRFDVAWATIGVLCWIADVSEWMESVAGTLRPGGQLVLIDGHPLANMVLSADPLALWGEYGGGRRLDIDEGHDYATPTVTGPQVQFAHSLGEIVSAAAAAGLRIIELTEHLAASEDLRLGAVARESDGRYRWRVDGQPLPVLFTLRAVRDPPS